ncbi:GNAT family N-acetyltransferase [Cohnella sp. GCM10027633]|uniref:GNAT family N-acetyltransferase n=1 Tax=unclassified Cohnella TaxID=2636738 RepID=UPI00363725C9
MLTIKQLADIERLQQECETYDNVQLKLNWDMLEARDSDRLDFFQYENDELVAFLGLYPFGSTVEGCGMVKPSERRRGHFQRLFKLAMERIEQSGYKTVLLNAPAGSVSGKAFMSKQRASYAFSEYQMEWQPAPIEPFEAVHLRLTTDDDYEMRVRLSVTAFGLDEEDARAMEGIAFAAGTDTFMIVVEGNAVGKIRVSRTDGQAWIYGFSILPEHQGQGIGRRTLRQVVMEQASAGYSVHLEVETKNDQALGLYESVGFKVVHAQDYYRL